jgi:IS30 family transposase
LVERSSRFVRIVKLENDLTSETTVTACEKALIEFPPALRKSLTYDRGKEMALHERLTDNINLEVYFADPHAPWQRGTNENTNGLIREFFPKGTDFSKHSIGEIKEVESLLNMRPRKVLQFATPEELMLKYL